MTPRQFAPGDRLLIEATATDDTAARLNLGQRASVPFGPGDVVEASGTVTEGHVKAALKGAGWPYCEPYTSKMRRALEAAALTHPAHAPVVTDEQVEKVLDGWVLLDWRETAFAAEYRKWMKAALEADAPVQAGSAAPADAAGLAAVQAERDLAVAFIHGIEWQKDFPGGLEKCPCCRGARFYGDHKPGCRLATALASSTSVGTGEASDA